jgi:hypothetical protein
MKKQSSKTILILMFIIIGMINCKEDKNNNNTNTNSVIKILFIN